MTPYPGMDMASLQQLMQQFEPNDADRKAARQNAILTLGLGLLGARKGFEMDRLGQAGLLAANTYQDRIKQEQAQRTQSIQQAMQLQNLMRQQALMKTAGDIMNGNDSGPAGPSIPAAGLPAGSVGGGGMGGGTATTFGLSSQPGPVASSAPAQTMQMPTWKQLAPREAKAMAAASGDPKVIIDLINKYSETKNGPNGLVTTFDGRPLYQSTEAGVQLFDPDTRMPAQFVPYPQASTDAAARRTAAIEGAKAGATEAAQFPYRTGSRTEPSGATTTGFLSDLYGTPSAANQPTAAGGSTSGRTISLNFPSGISPSEQAAVQRDIQASGYPQMGYTMAGAGGTSTATGPSPIALEAAKSAIQTNQAINTKVGDTVVGQLDKSYEPAYDAATKTIPQMQEARAILDSGKVITGAAANFQLEFGRWLSAAGMGGNDYVANTQAFMANQAKQVMSVVKQLGSGSGISNSDREYAAKAQGGQIVANEESIRRILDIGERASRMLIQSHNARVDRVAGTFPRADLVNQMHVPMPDLYSSPTQSGRAQMVGPGGQTQPAPDYSPKLQPPPNNELIMGKQAIRNGADPAAVRKRMIERGFDPSGL